MWKVRQRSVVVRVYSTSLSSLRESVHPIGVIFNMDSPHVIRVSGQRVANSYLRDARERLKSGTIELHGLGAAITSAVRIADTLTSQRYAVIDRVTTETLESEEEGRQRKPKVVIILNKATTYDQAMEEHLKSTQATLERVRR
mmetsp:Transcript_25770/g.45385  ORF Transcript_25770/g.45385 Transcript_25770/m.45385 type:complete len:143 (-) Transcript_25770:5937-6365(-)